MSPPQPFHLPACVKWQPSQRSLGPVTAGLLPALAQSSSGRFPRPLFSSLVAGFPSLSSWQRSASETQNGMSANHRQAQLWQSNRGRRSWKEEWYYTLYLPSLCPGVRTCSRPLDENVFQISSTCYSACQALCFIFPIAFPEINQSNTWSEASGIEKTVLFTDSPWEQDSCETLQKQSTLWARNCSSFKQAIPEEGEENPDDVSLLLLFLLLSCPALTECGSRLLLESAGIGWKSPKRLSAQLSSAQPSFGNGSSLCNKKILIFYFFSFKLLDCLCLECLWESTQLRLKFALQYK